MRQVLCGATLLLAALGCDDGSSGDPSPVDAGRADQAVDSALDPLDMAVDAAPDMLAPDQGTLDDNFGVEETEGDAQCEGLHPWHCLMPFPSDYFRAEIEDGRFGLRFGPEVLPRYGNAGQLHIRSEGFEHADGWGVASPILFSYPSAALPNPEAIFDPTSGLADDSPSVLLDADTGERVGHWLELDYLTLDEEHPVFVIRPAAPLARSRRYIVAIRGLADTDGVVLPATPGFEALRDGTASRTIGVHARRERFEAEIFAPLAEAGVERPDLQMAWDFTTASAANAHGALLSMRDQMLETVGMAGPTFTIDSVEPLNHPHIRTRIIATAEIPSFITPEDENRLRRLRIGPDGTPVAEGVERIEFELQIPHAAYEGDAPVGVMMYGHGLLGRRAEATGGYLREMAERYGFIILATDMQGMAEFDAGVWLRNLARDPTTFPWFSEKPLQGVTNQLALLRLVKGALGSAPELQHEDGSPIFDADDLMYYGNSQGGTIGTLMMAMTTDVERGVLGVPGCCYPLLLQRNSDFVGQYLTLFDRVVANRTEFSLLLGLLGTGFDRLDPWTYGPHVVDDPLPGTPRHDVLLHIAKEDPSVHNEVSFFLARAIGAPLLEPAVRPVWGLETATYPHVGSGTVEFDFGWPDDDTPLTPPDSEDNGAHQWSRRDPAAQEQMMHFLRTGEIIDTCEGACVRPVPER